MSTVLGHAIPLASQVINLCAAIMLLLGFAMLAQRRVLTLINLFMLQGLTLFASTLIVALTTHQNHLLWSAGLTLLLKVIALPYILHRLIRRLSVKWDIETLLNIPTIMLIGIALFFPFGIPEAADPLALLLAGATLILKLAIGGFVLALIETLSAKMRIFRAPEFLGTAFLLAVLAMLVHLLLEAGQ